MTVSAKEFWTNAYEGNISKLVGICYRYTRNQQLSEDLAQDAFLKAIDRFDTFEGKGKFEAWLRRIAVNHVLQYLRTRKKDPYVDDLIADLEPPDLAEENLSPIKSMTFTVAELIDTIDQLPEHHRLVFNLYVLEEFTHAQIGSALGINEGTSKSHLARARKKLKQLLVQKAEENSKEKEPRKALVLLLTRHADENMDQIFRKCFDDFSIPPQQTLSLESIQFTTNQHALSRSSFFTSNIKILAGSIAVPIILTVAFVVSKMYWQKQNQPAIEKNASVPSLAATILQDSIILQTNVKQKHMKPLDSLALMLALSSGSVNAATAKDSIRIQIEKYSNADITPPADSAIASSTLIAGKIDTTRKETGTFNATELYWSEVNNEVYFKGKVRVSFKEQHFEGNGSMTFLGKIHLLIIDGQEVTIGKTIKLANEPYQLAMLSNQVAIAKYGDKGLNGAVEISRSK
ncbi:MAG: RNA polymerase sigma factor [Agriterribacter sp.]